MKRLFSKTWWRRETSAASSVFFLHLPKTAGTSLRYWAWAQYPAEQVFPNHADIVANGGTYGGPERLTALAPERRAALSLVFAHYPAGAATLLPAEFRRGVMLREPLERSLSHLRHMMARQQRQQKPERSVEEWLEQGSGFKELQLGSLQTRLLGGTIPGQRPLRARSPEGRAEERAEGQAEGQAEAAEDAPEPPGGARSLLQRALSALEAFDVVGLTERYEESVALAAAAFGWRLTPHERRNVSDLPLEIDAALRRRLLDELEDDQALYEAARRRFERLRQEATRRSSAGRPRP